MIICINFVVNNVKCILEITEIHREGVIQLESPPPQHTPSLLVIIRHYLSLSVLISLYPSLFVILNILE